MPTQQIDWLITEDPSEAYLYTGGESRPMNPAEKQITALHVKDIMFIPLSVPINRVLELDHEVIRLPNPCTREQLLNSIY
jgi:hypothetical protein